MEKVKLAVLMICFSFSLLSTLTRSVMLYAESATIVVPDDFATIQEAINNAAEGDTVFVRAGTYYEHVIVSKSLTLRGEGREVTVIDGSMTGNVVRVTKDYVNITGFTIRRGGHAYTNSGIYVGSTRHCNISANHIVDSDDGIFGSPRDMSFTDNIIEGNFLGVALDSGATNNVIFGNHLVANYVGVHLNLADANFILQNNMTNNQRSVTLWDSGNNRVYHNNFLNDTFGSTTYANFLDNGLEGNYWSNYTGVDLDHDGIGDSPYVVDANNTDHHPLMGIFSSYNTSHGHTVDFVSNSSILNANFSLSPIGVYPPEAILSFNISGETGTGGFLRVCIPKNLINGSYVVRFDDEIITNTTYPRVRELPCSNETDTYFYVNYTHSEHTITITGSARAVVVPDDYATIQEAINNAIDGDTIYVKSGVYCEHVIVNKTVTLLGEDVSTTIVDGNGTGNVFTLDRNDVNIAGLTVQNSGGVLGNAGVRLDNVSFCSLSGNRIRNNFAGIWFEDSSKNLITANEIEANVDDGIVFNHSHNNTISENQIALHEYFGIVINWSHNNTICCNNITQTNGPSHGDGINLWRSSYNNIFQNRVEENNRYGIRVEVQSNNNTIWDNIIGNCTTGLQVYDSSSFNLVYENRIMECTDGIDVKSSAYTEIFNNTVAHNYGNDWNAGVRLESASYTAIRNNEIFDNWRGVLLYVSSPYVSIYRNNVTSNEYGVRVAMGGSNYVNITENYVADNRGYGIDVTGFGGLGESNYATIARNLIVNNTFEAVGLGTGSNYNTVVQNNMIGNGHAGVTLERYSNYNTVVQNNMIENGYGICFDIFSVNSTQNTILKNNIINNTQQVRIVPGSVNAWNGSYPSGGNHWSDYNGSDHFKGPYQNVTGSDGIGDAAYHIDSNNSDGYPLMEQYIVPSHDTAPTKITPSKTVVGRGHSLKINITVTNWGSSAETFNVSVYANTSEIERKQVNLESGYSTILVFDWNTSDFVKADYVISAYSWPVEGENLTLDNTLVGDRVIVALAGDITGPNGWPDGKVDMRDVGNLAILFGVNYPSSRYNANFDVIYDLKIDMKDISFVARNFGAREELVTSNECACNSPKTREIIHNQPECVLDVVWMTREA